MAQRFRSKHKIFIVVGFILLVSVSGALISFFFPPPESKFLNDPTLVATKLPEPMLFAPNTRSSLRARFYKVYYQAFPPKRGNSSFPPRPAPVLCSIQGLLNQCHDVSGVQFFIDKHVAGGTVMFGHTNTLNGPQWVTAFTNAVQTGEVSWWDSTKKDFRNENPVFIAVGRNAYLVLPKDRVEQFQKGK
jgi:hypothetical protein